MTTHAFNLLSTEAYLWLASLAALSLVLVYVTPELLGYLQTHTDTIRAHHTQLQNCVQQNAEQERRLAQEIVDAGHAVSAAHTKTVERITQARAILGTQTTPCIHTPTDEALIRLIIFQHLSKACSAPRSASAHEIHSALALLDSNHPCNTTPPTPQ